MINSAVSGTSFGDPFGETPVRTPVFAHLTVWLVGCHGVFQESFAAAVSQTNDLVFGGSFTCASEALAAMPIASRAQIVLINAPQGGANSVYSLARFQAAFPGVPVVLMLDCVYREALLDLIQIGARGCLLKTAPMARIIESIREVRNGGVPLAPEVASLLLDRVRCLARVGRDYNLTARELGILKLVVRGLLTKQIAQELELSYHTVDTHLRNIYSKLDVHSRTAAVAKALGERLV